MMFEVVVGVGASCREEVAVHIVDAIGEDNLRVHHLMLATFLMWFVVLLAASVKAVDWCWEYMGSL